MNNDHCLHEQPLAYRAYGTFAPKFILTRLLAHYKEIGLSDGQIRQLLDIKLTYRKYILEYWPKLINNWTSLDEIMNAHRIDENACKELIKKRSDLVRELDESYLSISVQIQSVITDKQNRLLRKVYDSEKKTYFGRIKKPLQHKFRVVKNLFGRKKE